MGDSRYAFSLTTFSPSGELVQIKYALNAVAKGTTSVGIKAKNGVIIATERKLPQLADETSVKKVEMLNENIGMTYAGLGADFRLLVKQGRQKAQDYFKFWKESIPVSVMVKELAYVMQEYTQSGGVRPFGVSLLVCGNDFRGPQLFQVDPSGSYFQWKASAIGNGMITAKASLERRYTDDITLDDAIHRAIRILKTGFQGEMNENNIEIGVIGEDKKFITLSPEKIRDYFDEVQ
eukprot:TRINITY_DN1887_c0_g2_i4.p1 TRINITY_DN1887_c0_g2~~TRINITY_DN1887_c0_g2_i4.p1  ORF type:complete len:235 (-),score=47.08 TRINITY_DN1887_c0_g2_i4:315-1019(-)